MTPIFLQVPTSYVGETDIRLRWFAEPNDYPYELVVKNQTGLVEVTYHTNQSGNQSEAIDNNQSGLEQECMPVGCIPSTAVAVSVFPKGGGLSG